MNNVPPPKLGYCFPFYSFTPISLSKLFDTWSQDQITLRCTLCRAEPAPPFPLSAAPVLLDSRALKGTWSPSPASSGASPQGTAARLSRDPRMTPTQAPLPFHFNISLCKPPPSKQVTNTDLTLFRRSLNCDIFV